MTFFATLLRTTETVDFQQQVADSQERIVFALIAIVATSVGALVFTIKNTGTVRDINRAVNNVGPGEHHLIDLIKQIQLKQDEFDKAWGNLPDDIDDAVGLVELLHGMNADIKSLQVAVAEHVEWELTQKYQIYDSSSQVANSSSVPPQVPPNHS